jgi:hypothetical protein
MAGFARTRWHPVGLARKLERLFEAVVAAGAPPLEWTPGSPTRPLSRSNIRAAPVRSTDPCQRLSNARQLGRTRRERTGWVFQDLRSHSVREGRMLAKLAAARVMAAR